jgi:tetratricopeptide (TPR) repeat protein
VLSEEALIGLVAFGACVLLVLGVLELLWPARFRRGSELPGHAPRLHRTSALARHTLEPGRSPYVRRATQSPPSSSVVGPPAPPAVVAAETAAAPWPRESIVEECFMLHQSGRHREAIDRASAALAGAPGVAHPADEQESAALWSVVALARQALGQPEAARAALETAIDAAPAAERAPYQQQLAALAGSVARGLLANAQRHPSPESPQCLTSIREAAAWLERGTASRPGDAVLAELFASALAMLWSAYERTVMALAQRQDFRAARGLLREALVDPRIPPERAQTFRELFSGTFSGEIGQLTAQAIRNVQEAREADALSALQRAETLLETLRDEALSPGRREEVDRRLWWGYRTLGERRMAAGDWEGALEPLLHAMAYDVGPDRQQETRALLVRVLDGIADSRTLGIRELADAGDREAAIVQCDKLWALLRGSNERGLTLTELSGVYAKVQRVFESLGRA